MITPFNIQTGWWWHNIFSFEEKFFRVPWTTDALEKLVFATWPVQLDYFLITTKNRQFLSAETIKNRVALFIIALISRWPRPLLHCGAGNGAGSMQEMAEMSYR